MFNIFLFIFGLSFGFVISSEMRLPDKLKKYRAKFRDKRLSKRRHKSLQLQALSN